jgi:hypothetical protein
VARPLIAFFVMAAAICFGEAPATGQQPQPAGSTTLAGNWRVEFEFSGARKVLTVNVQPNGIATAKLQDGETHTNLPASWSINAYQRTSFSTELELPIGTCCREIGTLVLKGKFNANGSLEGRAVFVTATEDEGSPIGLRTIVGSFTATKVSH